MIKVKNASNIVVNCNVNFDGLNDTVLERTLSFVLGMGLLLSISTSFRLVEFPLGPGETVLAVLACLGFIYCKPWKLWQSPVVLFWFVAALGMLLGAFFGSIKGGHAARHGMAYAFTSVVTVGLTALLARLSDSFLRRTIYWLCVMTAISLWFGFVVYIYGDVSLANTLRMVDAGDARYSGWSINPNQLALLFVPLPVWVAALWRDVSMPSKLQMLGFSVLLFGLMLMGLLVRSDGLFVVWVFEFFILIVLRLRWEMKSSRMSLLGYAMAMLLCVLLVKTFAQGEVRKSVRCAVESIYHGNVFSSIECYSGFIFDGPNKFQVGYGDPVEKTGLRQQLWINGLRNWLQSPLVGFGPGEYSWIYAGSNGDLIEVQESHNITIDLLTQGGVLAGGAFLVMLSYLLINAWRIRDSYTFSVVLMMAAFTFFHNTRQPYFWFVLAMSYEAIRRKLFVSHTSDKA